MCFKIIRNKEIWHLFLMFLTVSSLSWFLLVNMYNYVGGLQINVVAYYKMPKTNNFPSQYNRKERIIADDRIEFHIRMHLGCQTKCQVFFIKIIKLVYIYLLMYLFIYLFFVNFIILICIERKLTQGGLLLK